MRQEDEDGQETGRKQQKNGTDRNAAGCGNGTEPAGNRKKRKEIKRGLQLREIYYRSCSLCRDFMKYCFNTLTV